LQAAIKTQLKELEAQKNIKILLAVESGSRAWGCPSPDSDFDVRIIYVHPPNWYLSINDKKDTISYFHGELLDISGWELRKTLRLLKTSNATVFEWNQSPIVYQAVPNFQEKLQALTASFFRPRHSLNHYRGIAKNTFATSLVDGTINLKKLFYVIRPLLAATWIVEKGTIPPMDLDNLLPIVKDEKMVAEIKDLLRIKATANESYTQEINPDIITFIKELFEVVDTADLANAESSPDIETLNSYFRELLDKSWT